MSQQSFRSLNVGFNSYVDIKEIIAIVSHDSVPIKRLVQAAKKEGKSVDASRGRRTRSVILTDKGTLYLSCIQPETLSERMTPISVPERLIRWAPQRSKK